MKKIIFGLIIIIFFGYMSLFPEKIRVQFFVFFLGLVLHEVGPPLAGRFLEKLGCFSKFIWHKIGLLIQKINPEIRLKFSKILNTLATITAWISIIAFMGTLFVMIARFFIS